MVTECRLYQVEIETHFENQLKFLKGDCTRHADVSEANYYSLILFKLIILYDTYSLNY